MFYFLLLFLIACLTIALFMQNKINKQPVHTQVDQPSINPQKNARDDYFNHCVARFLLKKYPNMLDFSINRGKIGDFTSSVLGFCVIDEDGSKHYLNAYTYQIFGKYVVENDLDDYEEELDKKKLQNLLLEALNLIDEAKKQKLLSAKLNISVLSEEEKEAFETLLLNQGYKSMVEGTSIIIVVPPEPELI